MEWLKEVVDYGVIWLLIALSILSVGIAVERSCVYKKIDIEDFPDMTTTFYSNLSSTFWAL